MESESARVLSTIRVFTVVKKYFSVNEQCTICRAGPGIVRRVVFNGRVTIVMEKFINRSTERIAKTLLNPTRFRKKTKTVDKNLLENFNPNVTYGIICDVSAFEWQSITCTRWYIIFVTKTDV